MKKKDLNRFSFSKKLNSNLELEGLEEANVHVDKEKRIVVVEGKYLKKNIVGVSKCAPIDTFSIKIGMNLALYRFLRGLRGILLEEEVKKTKKIISTFNQLTESALKKANYIPRMIKAL